jgi:hypothetical protein
MARKGGVMGLPGVRAFLSSHGRVTLDDVLDHFDEVTKLVGVEQVASVAMPVWTTRPEAQMHIQGCTIPKGCLISPRGSPWSMNTKISVLRSTASC